MKSVIYLDVLLLVNFLIAWFLLVAAGLITGQKRSYPRLLCASALAALSALILFAPELPYPVQVLYKLGTAAAIVAVCYGVRRWRSYLAAICWYTALNLALAGGAMCLILKSRTRMVETANLTLYLKISPWALLLLSGLCCLVIELIMRFLAAPKARQDTVGLQVVLCSAEISVRAVLDTGCHLKDPITCLPVLLVSYPDAKARLPAELCTFLEQWFAGSSETAPPQEEKLRLIPCATASGKSLLPGFAVGDIDLITQNGILGLGRNAVAFTNQPFGSDRYEALYGLGFL